MKAIVYREHGSPDVLKLENVEKPTAKDNEVLVRVHAASINYADWVALTDKPLMMGAGWIINLAIAEWVIAQYHQIVKLNFIGEEDEYEHKA